MRMMNSQILNSLMVELIWRNVVRFQVFNIFNVRIGNGIMGTICYQSNEDSKQYSSSHW